MGLSSVMIWRQKFLEREMGSTSAALMTWDMGMMRIAQYSCGFQLV